MRRRLFSTPIIKSRKRRPRRALDNFHVLTGLIRASGSGPLGCGAKQPRHSREMIVPLPSDPRNERVVLHGGVAAVVPKPPFRLGPKWLRRQRQAQVVADIVGEKQAAACQFGGKLG